MSIAKSKLVAEDNNDWYIQDGTGSIWKVDLSFSLSMHKPARIYRYQLYTNLNDNITMTKNRVHQKFE